MITNDHNLEAKILEAYENVSEHVRENLVDACVWAILELANLEGVGHELQLSAKGERFCCSFSKPEWSGDHCGRYMDSAQEAIVMAVCEYLNGA